MGEGMEEDYYKKLPYILYTSGKQLYHIRKYKEKYYYTFDIDKEDGGKRTITAPKTALKRIQRNLLDDVLYRHAIVHQKCYGFKRKESIISNARAHLNKKIVFKTDIHDFFPSIKKHRIEESLTKRGFDSKSAEIISDLVTYKDVLPQGAPTSPFISNIVCVRLDTRLWRFAKICKLTYSRYADDLTFSGNVINGSIIHKIREIIRDEGFEINKAKTKVSGNAARQTVTGIIVNGDKPSFGKKNYLKLKAIIHNCKVYGVDSQNKDNSDNFKAKLYGQIALLKPLNKEKWLKLKEAIDSLDWSFYDQYTTEAQVQRTADAVIRWFSRINSKAQTNIFKEDNHRALDLVKTCDNEESFNSRMTNLFNWINSIDTGYFSISGIKKTESIYVLETYLKTRNFDSEKAANIIGAWRRIEKIAAGFERHRTPSLDKELKEIYKKYGLDSQNPNYKAVWFRILVDFSMSLGLLHDAL